MHLWNVSPTWTGWQYMFISTLAVQAVSTAQDRDDALARAADIALFIEVEIANLRSGQDQGYLAPAGNVRVVIEQMDALIETPVDDSPFMSPAARATDDAFAVAVAAAAIQAHRDRRAARLRVSPDGTGRSPWFEAGHREAHGRRGGA